MDVTKPPLQPDALDIALGEGEKKRKKKKEKREERGEKWRGWKYRAMLRYEKEFYVWPRFRDNLEI